MHKDRWLLPEGIDELLPAQARLMEGLRRDIFDAFAPSRSPISSPAVSWASGPT
jgi:hypothetical protein